MRHGYNRRRRYARRITWRDGLATWWRLDGSRRAKATAGAILFSTFVIVFTLDLWLATAILCH